jgi:Ca2+-binding EF-hand superfamily protein
MRTAAVLLALVLVLAGAPSSSADDPPPATPSPSPAVATADEDAVQDLILLAENRPVFLRLRINVGDRPFRAAWADSVRTILTVLDRDGDGTLTAKEADKDTLAALVRLATGGATSLPRGELDSHPKDGVVSPTELADALRVALGPFRVQVGRLATGRTDALFEHLDRNKDDQLTKPELAAIAGSLRRLDLDDNEMIGADELEPFRSPMPPQMVEAADRRARPNSMPPVVELVAGESSLRTARLLLRKYDKGRGEGPGPPDNKLTPDEFAIDPGAFVAADANGNGSLDTEELRRFIASAPRDLVLDIAFSPDASGRATARVGGDGVLPEGVKVRKLADGDVEAVFGRVRVDIRIDDGATTAADALRTLMSRFEAADTNKDGYLEPKELAARDKGPAPPLAGLFEILDRDRDGKLYPKELSDFITRQAEAARARIVLTAWDQGRAIFGILDLNRDRQLGAREVMGTVDRVSSWDSDGDGRVAADEIPYYFQVFIARGELSGLAGAGVTNGAPRPLKSASAPAAGPAWFRRMDRNRDGDISRREFLGPLDQFDRLDRDKDGLIDPDEAEAATPAAKDKAPARSDTR